MFVRILDTLLQLEIILILLKSLAQSSKPTAQIFGLY